MRRIGTALANCRLGHPLFYFKEVSSTNDVLRAEAAAGAPEGCVVIAGAQSAGRGRRGKQWLSLPGKGVYLSLLLRPRWPASESPYIAFFAALAAARTLDRLNIGAVKIKWPNDVLINGKKIGGVLVEPRINRGLLEFVVVGVGINVLHTREDLKPLGAAAATSCLLEGGHVTCDEVIINLLAEFDICYYMIQRGDKKAIIEEWARRSVKIRRQKSVVNPPAGSQNETKAADKGK